MLNHELGIDTEGKLDRLYKNQMEHDPSNLVEAQKLALQTDPVPIGLFYFNPDAPCYDEYTSQGMNMSDEDKVAILHEKIGKFAI
jgi:2-oxoglutarate ferredoxin oxidoreductase subunit beta